MELDPLTFLQSVSGYRGQDETPAGRLMRLAVVDPAYTGPPDLPRVTFEGEDTLSEKTFAYLSPVKAGDRVALFPCGTTYLVVGVVGYQPSQLFTDITLNPAPGPAAKAIILPFGYALYVDNVNLAGTAGNRLWLDTPDNADVVIGPRASGSSIANLRLRTSKTTSSAANMFLDASLTVCKSSSSRRYKVDITDPVIDPEQVLRLRPRVYRDRAEDSQFGADTRRYLGLVAEEVHDLGLTDLVTYQRTPAEQVDPEDDQAPALPEPDADDDAARPDGVMYERLSVLLLAVARAQQERITALETAVADLTDRLPPPP